jgi:hypothetical protein
MMMVTRVLPRLLMTIVTCVLLAASASAATGGFSATLSHDQQVGAGLPTLTAAQRAALDRIVAKELAQLRSGTVEELVGTFMSRRSEEEINDAGLDALSPQQLTALNQLAASALSSRPQPRERPRLRDSDVISAKRKPQIHGEVSFAYGWGSGGREMRAGSLWVEHYDPERRLGIAVGISQFEGDGFYGHPAYGYGYDWSGSRYYLRDPFFWDAPYYRPVSDRLFSPFNDIGWRGHSPRWNWRR